MQAPVLSAVVYRVVKTIQKPTEYEHRYTVDVSYRGYNGITVSVANPDDKGSLLYVGQRDIDWLCTHGSGVTKLTDQESIACVGENLEIYNKHRPGLRVFYHKKGYTPNGIAQNKSRFYWVCLWNHFLGENSHGLVVKLNGLGETVFEIESIKNTPLFTCPTYVAENGNEDVCVSDVGAVVVTDKVGMLRFRYTGRPGHPPFDPYGICCDSRCNIIVADMKNDKIHVIDQDGGFLHYIQYDGMKMPRALCIDKKDDLYVGEWNCDVIKLISRD
jgi:hypothetical protein